MSEAGDLLINKSFDFAVRIVNLYKWLCSEKKGVYTKQTTTSLRNEYRCKPFRSSVGN